MSPEVFVELPVSEFDLRRTLESGQVFHAMPYGTGWQILVDRTPLYAEQCGATLRVHAAHENLARNYFSLDHPLEMVYADFPSDPFSRAALATCRGLRILRQPRWECLATFITSPMKQVGHIRQISLQLRARYGDQIPGSLVNAFPPASRLAKATEGELRECKLGFRAKSLLGCSNRRRIREDRSRRPRGRDYLSGAGSALSLARRGTQSRELHIALCIRTT